jgi:hypothetical protein
MSLLPRESSAPSWTFALLATVAFGAIGCGGGETGSGLTSGGDGDANLGSAAGGDASSGGGDEDATTTGNGDAVDSGGSRDVEVYETSLIEQAYDGALVDAPGKCLAGHYSGAFIGTFTSSFTIFGSSTPVIGNIDLDLEQTNNGEFYSISNGTVSGTADFQYPYHCDLVGVLDCATKKLVNGALRHCVYCLGTLSADGGSCSGLEGYFNGPLGADYDSSIHAFVNGAWAGREDLDASAPLDAGSGCPAAGEFGGCGAWSAQYSDD